MGRGPLLDSTQHASHYMVEAQKRRARKVRSLMGTPWRELNDADLRERLRWASWRTDKLDRKSFTTLVKDRTNPSVAAFLDDVLGPLDSDEKGT